jgi:hypothetical protein
LVVFPTLGAEQHLENTFHDYYFAKLTCFDQSRGRQKKTEEVIHNPAKDVHGLFTACRPYSSRWADQLTVPW